MTTAIIVLGLIFGLAVETVEIISMIKSRKVSVTNAFICVYGLIYGLVPAAVMAVKDTVYVSGMSVDFSDDGIKHIFIWMCLSVAGYAVIKTITSLKIKKLENSKLMKKLNNENPIDLQKEKALYTRLEWTVLISLAIGIVSMFIWNMSFGGIITHFLNADAIRNGRITGGALAFFAHPAKLVIFSAYASLFLIRKKYLLRLNIPLFAVSFALSVTNCLLRDARMAMAVLFVVTIFMFFGLFDVEHKFYKSAFVIALAGMVFVVSVIKMNDITELMRAKVTTAISTEETTVPSEPTTQKPVEQTTAAQPEESTAAQEESTAAQEETTTEDASQTSGNSSVDNALIAVFKELSFVLQSGQTTARLAVTGTSPKLIGHDIAFAVFAWVPGSLTPDGIIDIWDYNTELIGTKYRWGGQIPSDIISTGIYDFGIIGALLAPAFWALVLNLLEKIRKGSVKPFLIVLYYTVAIEMVRNVMYANLHYFTLTLFFLFVAAVIHLAVSIIKPERFSKLFCAVVKYVFDKDYRYIIDANRGKYNSVPDREYIEGFFKAVFGRPLNLDSPVTFNEKIQWLKLFDRKEEYAVLADKLTVRDVVKERIGEEYLTKLYGVYNSFDEIDFDKLPEKFVLKTCHDSGGVVLCTDKNTFDKAAAEKKLTASLKRDYYKLRREYPYKDLPRRIICEEFLGSGKKSPEDYKFFCFNGKPDNVMVCIDRGTDTTKFYFFDENWQLLKYNGWGTRAPDDFTLPKPENFDKMLEIAAELSKGIAVSRIDLYNVDGKIYFGEVTFYPDSGFDKNLTPEADEILGKKIVLPD